MRRYPDIDCAQCFVKSCECTCNTCKNARERNDLLSEKELNLLNLSHAIKNGNESKV